MSQRCIEWLVVWGGAFCVAVAVLTGLAALFIGPFVYKTHIGLGEVLVHMAPLIITFAFCVSGAWSRERGYGW